MLAKTKSPLGNLASKESNPYGPDVPHNFTHDKLIVADDLIVTGSFNFSNHARGNAENTIILREQGLAQSCDAHIWALAARYSVPR